MTNKITLKQRRDEWKKEMLFNQNKVFDKTHEIKFSIPKYVTKELLDLKTRRIMNFITNPYNGPAQA